MTYHVVHQMRSLSRKLKCLVEVRATIHRCARLAAFLLLAQPAALPGNEIKLAGLFTDHTVLQRGVPVPVWGSADPGGDITVAFAGQVKNTKANAEGKWMVKLDPLKENSESRELTARASSGTQVAAVSDVLVGDVWLCSGQSNMHFQMKSVANAPKEIAAMNHPAVRFFTVSQQFGQQPLDDVTGAWKPVTPATAANCSAVACYFGAGLNKKIGIPIGLVVSSVGGTRIESWMRSETLASTGESMPLVAKWKNVSSEEFGKIADTYAEFQRPKASPRGENDKGNPEGLPVGPLLREAENAVDLNPKSEVE